MGLGESGTSGWPSARVPALVQGVDSTVSALLARETMPSGTPTSPIALAPRGPALTPPRTAAPAATTVAALTHATAQAAPDQTGCCPRQARVGFLADKGEGDIRGN
jgi:hypothetical protein